MTMPTPFDCPGCGHTRWIVDDSPASYPDEDGLCASCRDDARSRDAAAARDHYKARAEALLAALDGVLMVAEERMEPSQQHVHPDNRDGGEAYAEYLMRQPLLAARALITRINQEDSERG